MSGGGEEIAQDMAGGYLWAELGARREVLLEGVCVCVCVEYACVALCGEVCVGMVIQKVGLFSGWWGRRSGGSSAGVWVVIGWLGSVWDSIVWLACVCVSFGVSAVGC